MDFLDPKLERRNRMLLLIGYCLVALAIGIATLVLLYLSYGFGITKYGQVTQNGSLFVSSQPTGATIKFNNQTYKANTNTRVVIPSGTYTLQISKTDYRTWQRQVVVEGGDVQHFDYPFLFPSQLKTAVSNELATAPNLASQSPDKRWLLLGSATDSGKFTLYDLKATPGKPVASALEVPSDSITPGDGNQSWRVEEWASDNRHILFEHDYMNNQVASQEYILLDRQNPESAVNLTTSLKLPATLSISLYNAKTDQFYAYDAAAETLSRLTVSDGTEVSKLEHILAYKTYGSDKLLYVTDQAPSGKNLAGHVLVTLQDGQKTIGLRTLPANTTYVLNMAQYSGDWYIVAAAGSDSAAYVYRNPQSQVLLAGAEYPTPWRRLNLSSPTFLGFSSNAQYILAESGQNFVTYDLENNEQYHYRVSQTIDQPQAHASWMDGNRLDFVSGGNLVVFDYDYQNQQTLVPGDPTFLPFFSSDYRYLYTLRPIDSTTSKSALTATPLTVTAR